MGLIIISFNLGFKENCKWLGSVWIKWYFGRFEVYGFWSLVGNGWLGWENYEIWEDSGRSKY